LKQGIPTKFSREYLHKFEGTATIRVGDDEKTMEVNVRFEDGNKRSTLTKGWKILSKKYNLQVDDVCKFVMTQHRPLLFTINISRARKGPGPKKLLGFFFLSFFLNLIFLFNFIIKNVF
jgi:hypothetical protein